MKANPQIKLYKYDNSAFILIAIIDDYQQISFEHSLYSAGTFTVTINYNIPNARLFRRGLFVQFGNNPHDFGEILTMRNSIGPDGKGSEILNITGYDARYLFKRRIIRNLNANDVWAMTAKGEICLRSLVRSECGDGAESKRRLPISNVIPEPATAKGGVYSVSESYTNLYDALCTIATQSEIGWAVTFENGALALEVFEGRDLKDSVFFSTDFESLANGEYTDTAESFANVLYIGGKGEGSEQDMYEGAVTDEGGNEPTVLDRFEAYDSQSSMTTEEEYEAEAGAMLSQYSQNVTVSGAGLVKCPFVFRENYDVGDVITLRFSDKTAVTQILSVTEQWSKGSYTLSFSFGKPQNSLAQQISLLLKKISNASKKTKAIECVKWYTIPTDTAQSEADVTFDTLGFTGAMTADTTFTFYLDNEKTGAKSYNIYAKNLSGNYTLTLTTGVSGASNFTIKGGRNIVARILVDENGNIVSQSMTATDLIENGNNQPATSNTVANSLYRFLYGKILDAVGWYKICTFGLRNHAATLNIDLIRTFNSKPGESHKIRITYSWLKASIEELASCGAQLFDKIRVCFNNNNGDSMAIYVHYNSSSSRNSCHFNVSACQDLNVIPYNFETDSIAWNNAIEFNLGDNGLFQDGKNITPINEAISGNFRPITSNAVENLLGGCKIVYEFEDGSDITVPHGGIFFYGHDNLYYCKTFMAPTTVSPNNSYWGDPAPGADKLMIGIYF